MWYSPSRRMLGGQSRPVGTPGGTCWPSSAALGMELSCSELPSPPLHWCPDLETPVCCVASPSSLKISPGEGRSPPVRLASSTPCPHLEHRPAVSGPLSRPLSEHPKPSHLPDPMCLQGLPTDHGGQLLGREGQVTGSPHLLRPSFYCRTILIVRGSSL